MFQNKKKLLFDEQQKTDRPCQARLSVVPAWRSSCWETSCDGRSSDQQSTTQTARLITPLSLCSKPTAGIDSARYPPRDIYPQLEKITRGYRPLDYSNTFLNEHLKSSTSPYSWPCRTHEALTNPRVFASSGGFSVEGNLRRGCLPEGLSSRTAGITVPFPAFN